nr:MAG TPA: hypothetical protein [Caudoviricetes sp.]
MNETCQPSHNRQHLEKDCYPYFGLAIISGQVAILPGRSFLTVSTLPSKHHCFVFFFL